MRVTYLAGVGALLVHRDRVVYVDGDLPPVLTSALWLLMASAPARGLQRDVADLLAQHHETEPPPFVVVDGDQLWCHGDVPVNLTGAAPGADPSVAPVTLAPGQRLAVGDCAEGLPIVSGMVLASAWAMSTGSDHVSDQASMPPDPDDAVEVLPERPAPTLPPPVPGSSVLPPPATPALPTAETTSDEPIEAGYTELFLRRQEGYLPAAAAVPLPASSGSTTQTWREDSRAHMLAPAETDRVVPPAMPAQQGTAVPPPTYPVSQSVPPPRTALGTGASAPRIAPAAAHGHLTPRTAAQTPGSVLAAVCPSGHPSPAHNPTCRVCGRDVPVQEPAWIPRPSLGRFLLPGGDTLDVDRGAVFGRAPRETPGSVERPHLIDISSFGPHLSRMHLEVVIDGWFVMVRDLGSTEGTTLTHPGLAPQRLRPNELIQLVSGTLVDLAGDYVFTFDVS